MIFQVGEREWLSCGGSTKQQTRACAGSFLWRQCDESLVLCR